jgi:heme/copper-type cytochrome/quinol oxidase subunit 2
VTTIRRFLPIAPFALLALAAPQTRHVTVDMTQFAFELARLRVNRGDTVVLTLEASDVVHGFYLDGYGIRQRVEPGISQQITFVADRRGKFRYRCSVSCGPLHPFMIGEMIVGPNAPFWRALGLAAVALAGAYTYLTTTHEGRDIA